MIIRNALLLTSALLPLSAEALAQGDNGGNRRESDRFTISSWRLTTQYNYSDNFARLEEGEYERRFRLENGAFLTEPVIVQLPDDTIEVVDQLIRDTVPVDPVEGKAFITNTISGTSVFSRNRVSGIVRGSLRVGQYFDDADIADLTRDAASQDLPQEAIDAGATPTIGNRNFQETFVDPNLNGFASVDLIEGVLALEAGGFVIQQALQQGNQLLSQSAGQNFNEAVIGGVFISPVFSDRFADDQKVEVRLRNSSIYVLDEQIDPAFGNFGRRLNDSTSNEASILYETGYLFEPVTVLVEGFAREFTEDGSDVLPSQTLEQLAASITGEWIVSGRTTLLATVGYDDIQSRFDEVEMLDPDDPDFDPLTGLSVSQLEDSDLSGVFYSVGLRFEPSRRSEFSLSVGERYDGTQVNGTAQVRFSERLRFNASVNRQISSGLQSQQDGTRQLVAGSFQLIESLRRTNLQFTEQVLDRVTAASFASIGSVSQNNFGPQPLTRIQAALAGNYRRTNISIGANATILDDVGDSASGRGRLGNQYAINANAARQLSRKLSINVGAAYRVNEPGQRADEDLDQQATFFNTEITEQFYQVGLNYNLSRRWGVTAGYQHLRREVDREIEPLSLFIGTPFEYRENQWRLGARLNF